MGEEESDISQMRFRITVTELEDYVHMGDYSGIKKKHQVEVEKISKLAFLN